MSVPVLPHIPLNLWFALPKQFPSSQPRTLHHEPRWFQRRSFFLQLCQQGARSAQRGKDPLQQPRPLTFNDGWGFVATSRRWVSFRVAHFRWCQTDLNSGKKKKKTEYVSLVICELSSDMLTYDWKGQSTCLSYFPETDETYHSNVFSIQNRLPIGFS